MTEPGRSSATWSSSSTKKSRVSPRMAGMSEARKAAPSVTPISSGDTRRAATIRSGSSAWTTATEKAPRTRPRAVADRAEPGRRRGGRPATDSMRWARTSVSVSDSKTVAGGGELVGQLDVVLDDPVVDEGQPARAVDVGVGVALGRTRRGWPTGCGRCRRSALGRRLFGPLDQVVEGTGPVGRPGPPQPVCPARRRPGPPRPSRSPGTRGGPDPRAGRRARRCPHRRGPASRSAPPPPHR